jgi:hypothetical protein
MKAKVFVFLAMFFVTGTLVYSAIELVTVPKRDSVQLTIYNSADLTMVRETRALTFKKGMNRIQFSWAKTLIDPTSLRISFKDHKDKLDLLDTTFPPGRNDALQWNIQSEMSGPSAVEIIYFTSGISWKADYVLISDKEEKKMDITGYVKVENNSGEDYPNAQVRLVVGTINLVEKISDLARGSWRYRDGEEREKSEAQVKFKKSVDRAERNSMNGAAGSAKISMPKQIIKEGLSEYFLFSIEGTETIPDKWQKRLRSIYVENIPLTVIYKLSDAKTSGQVHKAYEFFNKKIANKKGAGQLGESPLPDGVMQIFSEKGKNLSYMGAMYVKYVATGDKVKLDSGRTGDVKIKRALQDQKKTNIVVTTDYYKNPHVSKYLTEYYYQTNISNTLSYPVKVEIERSFAGDYTPKGIQFKWEKVDKYTLRFYPDLGADEKKIFTYQVDVKTGY